MKLYEHALQLAREQGAEAMIVTNLANIRYISGYTNDTGCLLLMPGKQYLLTDFRFLFQAKEEAADFIVKDVAGTTYAKLLGSLLAEEGCSRAAFEKNDTTYAQYEGYEKEIHAELIPVDNILAALRFVKTEDELAKIAKAEEIGDLAFTDILKDLKPGVTEQEIAAKLTYYMHMHGADGLSFPPIVASGVNSSMPHAIPSKKKLQAGDFVTMDFGCTYEGYCSDMTRTVVIGQASEKQKEIYEIVLRAQEETLKAIHAGMTGKEIDAVSRTIIGEAGYGDCYGHGLGHSVGLEIHEPPFANPRNSQIVGEDMLMTVEPGIYVQDFGGVRIEDLVIVTKDGCKNLASSPKKLIEIPISEEK